MIFKKMKKKNEYIRELMNQLDITNDYCYD